jgi:MFS family permease
MSQALYAKANPKYDEEVASRWQAMQVSSISVTNFLGRILIGLAADVAKNHLHVPRSYCLTLVSSFFLASQIFAASIQNVQNLWRASTLLGLAYGGVFGLFPTICIEWFGLCACPLLPSASQHAF